MSVTRSIQDRVETRQLRLASANGEPLALTRFTPGREPADGASAEPRDAVIISAAMATKASYYAPFARWLAARGTTVYTYDYQGFGASLRPDRTLKDTTARMTDWMDDAHAMVDFVAAHEAAGTRLHWLGQSLGGQLLAFTDTAKLTSATVVATGTGSVHFGDWPNRALAPLLWYAIAPVLTRLYGYFPGSRFGILGDVPASLTRQWGRWCKRRDYMFHDHPEFLDRYASVRTPIVSIRFSDDETISSRATDELERWYSGAPLRRLRFTPQQLGLDGVGHIGIFRSGNSGAWPTVFEHLPPID